MTRNASTTALISSDEGAGRFATARRILPGLVISAVAVGAALAVNTVVPTVSPLLIAIVLGVVLRNTVHMPNAVEPGLAFAAKKLLRAGIVLLGLDLVLGDILSLGPALIVVVIAIVTIGILITLLVGKWLGISATQRLLIACGFSICGAAAVAAVDGVIETEDEQEVVTAVALVVIFGTLMIPLIPLASEVLGLTAEQSGMWAGGSIHEVAQVVAVGGTLGGAALGVAVVVKLARVLMLAPVMAAISLQRRRALKGRPDTGKLPPIIPLFVVGFMLMVLLRSSGIMPDQVIAGAKIVQTALLTAAMFALGTGVRFATFSKVGPKPFVLAAVSTLVVAAVALGGTLLVSLAAGPSS